MTAISDKKLLTITEALAELKTLKKRVEKKHEAILNHLVRQEKFKDPLEKNGGSSKFIEEQRQSISDLNERIIRIRSEIQSENNRVSVDVLGETRTITAWLIWRRDVAPAKQAFLKTLSKVIAKAREEAKKHGVLMVTGSDKAVSDDDIAVHTDEAGLAASIEKLEETLGTLDGKLSLVNATSTILV